MKKFLFIILSCIFCITTNALTIPNKPTNYVNDYAHILSPATINKLDSELKKFENKTSNQIVVVTFPSLDGNNLDETSTRIENKWHIGTKKHNNGVILSIFKKDHKMRIEVGYGLEATLTDEISGQIIRNEITPSFHKGNYDRGVLNGVKSIMQATQNTYKASNETHSTSDWISALIVLAIVLFFIYFTFRIIFQIFCAIFYAIFPNKRPPPKKRRRGFWSSASGGFLGGDDSSYGGSSDSGGGGGFGGGDGGDSGGGGADGGW
jgi:uncharacterized protein